MTSVLRAYSQIPVRAKYLLAVSDLSGSIGAAPSDKGAFTLPAGEFLNMTSIAEDGDIVSAGYAGFDISSGMLFKDMGRQITIFDRSVQGLPHLAVFRQVQLVSGPASEGVGGAAPAFGANIYVKVWAADGQNVVVVRTG
jgi:hypothetical protein